MCFLCVLYNGCDTVWREVERRLCSLRGSRTGLVVAFGAWLN